MQSNFCHIDESNKTRMNKPVDSNMVYYSELHEWYTSNAFRSFSLKYVVDRCIHYRAGNKEYRVEKGQFLVACRQPWVKAYFDSGETVKSICIDIRPETVAEAFAVMHARDRIEFDNFSAHYFREPYFFESVHPIGSAPFRPELESLLLAISQGQAGNLVDKEWFMGLVEKLICFEFGNFLALNGLRSVKTETRKELLRRLLVARDFMDQHFLQIGEISEVASYCSLSEFHFFRSFKQAFQQTPYQYLLQKRLAEAKKRLTQAEFSVTEIALQCNFPDIYTFSKAFKKHHGMPPSVFRAGCKE